jgi:hypothetical protein
MPHRSGCGEAAPDLLRGDRRTVVRRDVTRQLVDDATADVIVNLALGQTREANLIRR